MVWCFGLCGGTDDDGELAEQGDNSAVVDTKRLWQPSDGSLTVTRSRASGIGQVFADQTVLQDRAYWEVTVESLAARCGLALGVVGRAHSKGEPLGGSAASWALTASDMPPLQTGDVLGVYLDQGDYPVTLRYAHNGNQIPASACLSPSAEALPAVQLGGEAVRVEPAPHNPTATSFAQRTAPPTPSTRAGGDQLWRGALQAQAQGRLRRDHQEQVDHLTRDGIVVVCCAVYAVFAISSLDTELSLRHRTQNMQLVRRDTTGSCRAHSPALHVGRRDRVASRS